MALKLLSSSLRSVLVLAARFGVGCFQRNSKALGFGRLSTVGHFPGAAAGLGCWQFVGAAAFSAVSSNTTVKAAPAFGLRWTLRDKASRSAPYLQR